MAEFEEPVKVYMGLSSGLEYLYDDERAFHWLVHDIQNRKNEVDVFKLHDNSLDSVDSRAWCKDEFKMVKDATPSSKICFEKQYLNGIVCRYLTKFKPYIPHEVAFQLRFPKDQQPMSFCLPGMMCTLDCGVKIFCDWLMNQYGHPIQNWGPKAIFLVPGFMGKSALNPEYKVTSKFDRSLEMFKGSRNQCVDWISHRVKMTADNYEIAIVK